MSGSWNNRTGLEQQNWTRRKSFVRSTLHSSKAGLRCQKDASGSSHDKAEWFHHSSDSDRRFAKS